MSFSVLAAACATPKILNPDPVHGGECKTGDQLGFVCGPECCVDGDRCIVPLGDVGHCEQDMLPIIGTSATADGGSK